MKKLYTLISLSFYLINPANAQSDLLVFDGVNDYVNLGSSALTGVRTVEMWFTPGVTISSSSLSDYSTLIARNDFGQDDELNLVFAPTSAGAAAGRLIFHRNISGTLNYIGSINNLWQAGNCYHVAAVIDPVTGMKMYIDGVLQTDMNSITTAPGVASEITTIGCFGDNFIRYFNGKIDEVRFWNVARSATEIASTYQYTMGTSTSGLCGYWPFDEGTGTTTIDATVNTANGTISGATWGTSSGCLFIGVNENLSNEELNLTVFPNPINENSVIEINKPADVAYSLNICDVTGKIIWSKSNLRDNQISLSNLININAGIYVLQAVLDDENKTNLSTKLIIK